jgi:hypothetical protein
MASPTPVAIDAIGQIAPSSGDMSTNGLHGSRSMPDLSRADVNLRNTQPAPGIAVSTSPPNVSASTEAVESDQASQAAIAAKMNECPRSTQSPKLSTSDGKLQSTPLAPVSAESAPPSVTAPEGDHHDYLEKVKELCDRISPGLYDELFEKHFQEGHGEVLLINKEKPRRILPRSGDPDGRWKNLESGFFLRHGFPDLIPGFGNGTTTNYSILKNLVTSATEENPHVLIVEGIDRTGVRILGTAFNIDPCFVARHLGTMESRIRVARESEMKILSHQFKNFVNCRNRVPSHAKGDLANTPEILPGYMMDGSLWLSTDDGAQIPGQWPGAGTDRLHLSYGVTVARPRVSCQQVSLYGCKT